MTSGVEDDKQNLFTLQTRLNILKPLIQQSSEKLKKNLAGYTSVKTVQSVINDNCVLEGKNLANAINESFVAVNKTMLLFLNLINHPLKFRANTIFQSN